METQKVRPSTEVVNGLERIEEWERLAYQILGWCTELRRLRTASRAGTRTIGVGEGHALLFLPRPDSPELDHPHVAGGYGMDGVLADSLPTGAADWGLPAGVASGRMGVAPALAAIHSRVTHA